MRDLALDDHALALDDRDAAQPHQVQRRRDRRQGVAQLVPEHGEELVLGAVGGLRRVAQLLLDRARLLQLQLHVADKKRDEQLKLAASMMDEKGLSDVNRGYVREVYVSALLHGKPSSAEDIQRAEYVGITDAEALQAFHDLCRFEGIIPALESSHALAYAAKLAPTLPKDKILLVNLSGRGDKDMHTVAEKSGITF